MTTANEPKRGLIEAARQDKGWGGRLKELADNLSNGDKSALVAMLQSTGNEDVAAMTPKGSANDWFWAHLSNVGFMRTRDDQVQEPLKSIMVAYSLTQQGRRLLPGLLRSLFFTA
ncbi:hypothetical protein KMP13_12050 [Epibacterium ulvae]|uniref:hypothetical protein n=1 Tax=Epibacterium ulvae TaxID=1156985 RepID=UPI001BFCC959|nr:hypothetical protein [Epibacterium ulvae]MBT8154618.1 hypothetical protein [Epibacterium ulvae]